MNEQYQWIERLKDRADRKLANEIAAQRTILMCLAAAALAMLLVFFVEKVHRSNIYFESIEATEETYKHVEFRMEQPDESD